MTVRTDATTSAALAASRASLAADVRYYLTLSPRQLPSSALYDALGSALFDAICELPWYPVTRAERRLISSHRAEIFEAAGRPPRLIELGGGNGEKLRLLLGDPDDAVTSGVRRIDLVDVSPSALAAASRLVGEDRDVRVVTHTSRYEDGLLRATAARGRAERCAVLFLGSNIGNFDPPAASAFLVSVRTALRAGDCLIIGADLVKPAPVLHAAYDDPLGVTAAFNKNLLLHLNRELGATFAIDGFDHRAVWNAGDSRVEMHLVSRRRQRVEVPASGLSFELAEGETILTESSYKYSVAQFTALLTNAGFTVPRHFVDGEGQFLLVVAAVN
jgi:L-histidine N-alpha-methyltransferase